MDLEVDGFIAHSDWYALTDDEAESIYVADPDWNEWVKRVSSTVGIGYSMSIVFDEAKKEVQNVDLNVSSTEDY